MIDRWIHFNRLPSEQWVLPINNEINKAIDNSQIKKKVDYPFFKLGQIKFNGSYGIKGQFYYIRNNNYCLVKEISC